MIGEIFVGEGKGRLLLKFFNKTRYETAGLVDALVHYFTSLRASFSAQTSFSAQESDWPRLMVLDEWYGSADAAPCQKKHVTSRLNLLRVLRPEKADKTKCVVDRVGDLEEWRASPDVIGHFVWMVGSEFGSWQRLPDDLLCGLGGNVKILPTKQEPNMEEVAAYLGAEFENFASNQIGRMSQAADTMKRRIKSRAGWSQHFGFDVEKTILDRAPPHVRVWLDATNDPRRARPEKSYKIEEKPAAPPMKFVFRGKVS